MPEDTADRIARLQAEIAALRQSLGIPGLPEVALETLRAELAEKDAALARLSGTLGIGSVTAQRDVNIATNQTILNLALAVYGVDPGQEQREQLARYLDRLAAKLVYLPLRSLDERLNRGEGIALPHVYVMLATQGKVVVARGFEDAVKGYFVDGKVWGELKPEFAPRQVLPDRAIIGYTAATNGIYTLERSTLATEALAEIPRLVLCGDPGSGKSTFVRYLAWALAQQFLGRDAPALAGWPGERQSLPVIIPVRTLAGDLEHAGPADQIVFKALVKTIVSYGAYGADELLSKALDTGSALLLFDGLDEVPLDRVPGSTVDRATAFEALKSFARTYRKAGILITTRTRAFDEESRASLGWPVATLAPLTLGQMRFFVKAWYNELAAAGQLAPEVAARLERELIAAVERSDHLNELGRTPLLLTLMALVLYNKGELPRDRPQLYERVLELLLGQWDKVREGSSLSETLGLTDWTAERFRPLLDQLSYQAHRAAQSADGRGRLARSAVRDALIAFFVQAGFREDQAMALAGRCLDYFSQRSGLLVPDDASDSYTFAHLTLQEHCAGRFIATSRNPIELILKHRADDRWREPILLGLGSVQAASPFLIESVIRRLAGSATSDRQRQQRDLVLAAEIGADRDWAVLRGQGLDVDELETSLRVGLAGLLEERAAPLPVDERLRAGRLLGAIGDPRFPVTLEQWRHTLTDARPERFTSEGSHYWRYVPGGRYKIGGWGEGEASVELELAPFWVARLPITAAQFATFIEAGGYQDERWWTPEGNRWRGERRQPELWMDAVYHEPNQPMTIISWYEATACCAWLSAQLMGALPEGYLVRLPTEAEWEAAASADGQGGRRTYPWGNEDATPERAIYDSMGFEAAAPVGCCPTGAAACGALDIAGNVWELTCSSYESYPAETYAIRKDFANDQWYASLRGGSYSSGSSFVRCGARDRFGPDLGYSDLGFRVCVSPRFAYPS